MNTHGIKYTPAPADEDPENPPAMSTRHPKFEAYVEACNYPGRLDAGEVEAALARYLSALGEKRGIVRLPAGWKLAQFPSLEAYVDGVLKGSKKVRDAMAAMDARDARAAMAARDAMDAMDAMDARDARAAMDCEGREAKERFASWCIQCHGWGHWRFELSLIVTTLFGAKTEYIRSWSEPLMDSFLAGCWLIHWTEDTLYWVSKPRTHTIETPQGKRMHRTDGPALESDIKPLYFLNGVLMDRAHVLTPVEKLDATEILKEPNVDIRRELIRKVGVELMLAKLPHKVLDRRGDYELLGVDFPDLVQDARYLKMLNPSIGVWHMEGVERSCATVQQAIDWRAGDFAKDESWKPEILT